MNAEKLELVHGSGNVFRDLGRENADVEQLKALLAAEIIKGARPGRVDCPRPSCANRFRRSGFLAYPQRRPRKVHG